MSIHFRNSTNADAAPGEYSDKVNNVSIFIKL